MNHQSWLGVQDSKFGYGAMLKGFVDHAPKVVSFDDKASTMVHVGVPYSLERWFKGQYKSCFTMWETDALPAQFVRWLAVYDQIIVPCQHNVELFSPHHPNVQYVPLGVDRKFWVPQPDPSGVFRFHAGGSLWTRKGLDIAVKAFAKLRLPDAELHIKAAPHARDVPSTRLPAGVFLNRDWMTMEQQRDWYAKAHVFVAPARGEGFGLMPLQAISMGIPTIVSHSSGQVEFEHLATGVAPTRKSQANIGFWDETHETHLAELMMDHYRNWADKRTVALENAKQAEQFNWRKSTAKLLAVLPTGTLLTKPDVEHPDITVPIQVKKNETCDIGTQHFVFKKGETYRVTEAVHQVLFDAGVLA